MMMMMMMMIMMMMMNDKWWWWCWMMMMMIMLMMMNDDDDGDDDDDDADDDDDDDDHGDDDHDDEWLWLWFWWWWGWWWWWSWWWMIMIMILMMMMMRGRFPRIIYWRKAHSNDSCSCSGGMFNFSIASWNASKISPNMIPVLLGTLAPSDVIHLSTLLSHLIRLMSGSFAGDIGCVGSSGQHDHGRTIGRHFDQP